ncbi:helix-turn-helix domain-containing protein [Yersinia sp. 2545 StPb PI]|uniref:helix-turn-helix domain-containing protein n=1 Tax=Yersinia sp. 2545 StPb PI TaxID=3117410 RepID=UPI003FA48602
MGDVIIFSNYSLIRYTLKEIINEVINESLTDITTIKIQESFEHFKISITTLECPLIILDMDGISRLELSFIFDNINKESRLFLYTSIVDPGHSYIMMELVKISCGYITKVTPVEFLKLTLSNFILNHEMKTVPFESDNAKVKLTKREEQVIHYILKGDSNSEIAKKLNINNKTISTHRTNILKKFQLKNTIDLYKELEGCK